MTDLTSALRPVSILEFVASKANGATLREVRDELDLPRSSVWSLVKQLEDGGMVTRVDSRLYAGPRLVQMGLAIAQTASMSEDSRSHLQHLSRATELDVYLAIRTGDTIVYADRFFGTKSVQIRHRLGEPRSLHATAAGKIFLAYENDGLWDRCIKGKELTQFTPYTLTDPEELRAQLLQIRACGYVYVVNEILTSISSLAAVTRNADHSPWAAIVVSGHESDLASRREEILRELLDTTSEITARRLASAPRRVTDVRLDGVTG